MWLGAGVTCPSRTTFIGGSTAFIRGLRSENSDGQCLLVIIGVKPDGSKERVAIGDGYRETKASWLELLQDLK